MFYVITGGSASGKSQYAEKLASSFEDRKHLYYVATMYPYSDGDERDSETEKRIKRHRDMRADKGFITIEKYTDIGELTFGGDDVVLLECMSNLLANEMYLPQGNVNDKTDLQTRIIEPLIGIASQVKALIVVTNEIFSDVGMSEYDESTRSYIANLGFINCALAGKADKTIEVCCGIPVGV